MRPYRPDDDVDLLNEAEIDAALNAALETPLNDLLSIEEFAEKNEASETTAPEFVDANPDLEATEQDVEGQPETLRFDAKPWTRAA